MMMENNNTIAAFHIRSNKDGVIKLQTNKTYCWHIPKPLRNEPIQKGDIVLVRTRKGPKAALVMKVFREEFEETQRQYRRVIKVLERAPEKEPVH